MPGGSAKIELAAKVISCSCRSCKHEVLERIIPSHNMLFRSGETLEAAAPPKGLDVNWAQLPPSCQLARWCVARAHSVYRRVTKVQQQQQQLQPQRQQQQQQQ